MTSKIRADFICSISITILCIYTTLASRTFVIPSPFLSTFAQLSTFLCTLVCNLFTSLLFTISLQGYSEGCWKNEISGHSLRTSLSICKRTSLSLKNVCHSLSGLLLRGWSHNVVSPSSTFWPGMTIISSEINQKIIGLEKWCLSPPYEDTNLRKQFHHSSR